MAIDPRDPVATTNASGAPDATELLDRLDDLGDLAVVAERLAQLLGVHGADALGGPQRSALEQARDNASAIIASLDRAN